MRTKDYDLPSVNLDFLIARPFPGARLGIPPSRYDQVLAHWAEVGNITPLRFEGFSIEEVAIGIITFDHVDYFKKL